MSWRWFRRSAARRARAADIARFRAELEAAGQPRDASGPCPALQNGLLGRLAGRADELALTEDEGALELEMLDGLHQLAAFVSAVERDGLPVVESQHRIIAGERCRFSAPATRLVDASGSDAVSGRLFLTDTRVVFLGPSVAAAAWASIAAVGRVGRDVLLSGTTRRHQFRLNTFADALRAAWISERLRCP